MNSIINLAVTFWHVIYNNNRRTWFLRQYRKLYTAWVKNEFASCGCKCSFHGFSSLREPQNIYIGNYVKTGNHVVFELYSKYLDQTFAPPKLSIGDYTHVGDYCHFTCCNEIRIGKGVLFGRHVFITDNSHGLSVMEQLNTRPFLRPLVSKGKVIIEDNVWVGENVCIMPNVKIGQGAIIGANAVVTKDIPAFCVAGGVPAKILKEIKSTKE